MVCDVFNVSGRGLVCGPALLIVGFAKCGTNSLAAYIARHPHVHSTRRSEVVFDPHLIDPAVFVARNAPRARIGPHDDGVWFARKPLLGYESWQDTFAYAKRLRKAFPSASIALCLCDPDTYPYRWFRHAATNHFLCRKADNKMISAEMMEREVRHRFNLSLVEAYNTVESWGIAKHRARCMSPGSQADVLTPPVWSLLNQEYVMSLNCRDISHAVSFSDCVFNARFASWRDNQDCNRNTNAGLIETAVAARFVHAILAAGYTVNQSIAVAYMESWDLFGTEYLHMMQRIMHVPLRNMSAIFKPRYNSTKNVLPEGVHVHENIAWNHECSHLHRLLQQYPPWTGCKGLSYDPASLEEDSDAFANWPGIGTGTNNNDM
ncbi:MAG: hypothetical protein SGPRY_010413, partial [Prymnesium sp.]